MRFSKESRSVGCSEYSVDLNDELDQIGASNFITNAIYEEKVNGYKKDSMWKCTKCTYKSVKKSNAKLHVEKHLSGIWTHI